MPLPIAMLAPKIAKVAKKVAPKAKTAIKQMPVSKKDDKAPSKVEGKKNSPTAGGKIGGAMGKLGKGMAANKSGTMGRNKGGMVNLGTFGGR